MNIKTSAIVLTLMGAGFLELAGYSGSSMAIPNEKPCDARGAGKVLDEAKCAGRTAESMPGPMKTIFMTWTTESPRIRPH